jgi:hypothetical protein
MIWDDEEGYYAPSQVFYDIQRNSCCFFLCFIFSMGYEVPEFKHTTIYDTSLPTYNDLSAFSTSLDVRLFCRPVSRDTKLVDLHYLFWRSHLYLV